MTNRGIRSTANVVVIAVIVFHIAISAGGEKEEPIDNAGQLSFSNNANVIVAVIVRVVIVIVIVCLGHHHLPRCHL